MFEGRGVVVSIYIVPDAVNCGGSIKLGVGKL